VFNVANSFSLLCYSKNVLFAEKHQLKIYLPLVLYTIQGGNLLFQDFRGRAGGGENCNQAKIEIDYLRLENDCKLKVRKEIVDFSLEIVYYCLEKGFCTLI